MLHSGTSFDYVKKILQFFNSSSSEQLPAQTSNRPAKRSPHVVSALLELWCWVQIWPRHGCSQKKWFFKKMPDFSFFKPFPLRSWDKKLWRRAIFFWELFDAFNLSYCLSINFRYEMGHKRWNQKWLLFTSWDKV